MAVSVIPSGASAAGWEGWSESAWSVNCETNLWVDANTYTKNATTIDYQVKQRGNCGKIYYDASINTYGHSPVYYKKISPTQTGYFSNITPVKQFKISSLTKTGVNAVVLIEFYKDAAKTRYVGSRKSYIKIDKR